MYVCMYVCIVLAQSGTAFYSYASVRSMVPEPLNLTAALSMAAVNLC